MNHQTTRNQSPFFGSAKVLIVLRTHAALAVLAVAIVACSQASEGGTSGVGPTTTAASATSATTSVEPLATSTTQVEVATPQLPVEFTGRIVCGPPVISDRRGDSETLDVGDEALVLTRYRGGAWRQTVTMTDPRLEGTVYHTWESDTYAMQGAEDGMGVWAATLRIENEAGAWEERGYGGTFSDGTEVGEDVVGDSVWIGEGAYEGLIAIMESTSIDAACGVDVRGVIFDGAPIPEPYTS